MAESATNPVDSELTGLVEDPQEAARLLVRLRRMRNVITLRAAQSPREFSSILLSLDLTHRYLVLDAPRPRPQPTDFRPGTKVYARSHVDGAALVFIAQLNSFIAADDTGDDNLVLEWPTRVSYYQRRRDYRVSVPSTVVQTPARLLIDERVVNARLLDLSTAGIAILLADASTSIAADTTVECILPLPERDLKVPLRITAVTTTRDGVRISGELHLEDSRSRELIQRTVTTLERWWLQHHP